MARFSYQERIDLLRAEKLEQTKEKQEIVGFMDHDDWGLILPPPEEREIVKTMSSSGMPITDVLLRSFKPKSNHPSGGFFGPKACGENFRRLLEVHPVYIDPISSLAGGYMVNFMSYRDPHWNPDFDYSHLHKEQELYQLVSGIGATQHFCQDMEIGLKFGWKGILDKIRYYRGLNGIGSAEFYDGLEDVVIGIQNWIRRASEEAYRLSEREKDPEIKKNLLEIAKINEKLVNDPPSTFREACQWILWYLITARMYNGSGSLGRLDVILYPFYKKDIEEGILTDEEAIFHIACLLLRDTAYIQLGGYDRDGNDATNPVSYLILEAAHRLKIPANIGVCVGKGLDNSLLYKGVEILLKDKTGIPKFLGADSVVEGFAKNGYPVELARERAYAGCHWYGIPGREYTLMDCVKINFAVIFDVALREMMKESGNTPSTKELWDRFTKHMRIAIDIIAKGLDFHLEYMHKVFPELVLDLCSYGPIEKGLDASHGGVEFYNMCIDGAGLATVADSFAAIEQRIEREGRLTWQELMYYLDNNWAGTDGERIRLLMKNIPRYGSGGSLADEYAVRISKAFTKMVKEKPTPNGFSMIPGLFSWANTIPMGKNLGATPNGRYTGAPISHGANPDPGFRKDGAATAMAIAIANVQPGYGNTAPMQIEIDPLISDEKEAIENIATLIKTHFDLGGTMVNINVMDAEKVLEAHKDPSKYPDLVVRVTGFSAYFSSLSPEFRQLVVDRIIANK
jgi:formate C-acetyltransferase